MNNSTENVTLFAVFVRDVLAIYEDQKDDYQELFDIVKEVDLSDPFAKVPMVVYNDVCQWIEDNLGQFNLIRAGRIIGEIVYKVFQEQQMVPEKASPQEVIDALKIAADTMIQDPLKRGWEILEKQETSILMRRTQTFNSGLQFGLLDGLVKKTGAYRVEVNYAKSVQEGDEFDEYRISWAGVLN